MAPTETLSLWWHLPFALILLSIAMLPALVPNWWERRYAFIVPPLGAVVAFRYLTNLENAGSPFAPGQVLMHRLRSGFRDLSLCRRTTLPECCMAVGYVPIDNVILRRVLTEVPCG